MTSLQKHKQCRFLQIGAIFLSLIGVSLTSVRAQITNGVFDPSKVLVAKEKAMEVESITQNIKVSNEFNKTLGTPDHPRPHIPVPPAPEPTPGAPPNYGPEPVDVPTFDQAPRKKRRRGRKMPIPTVATPQTPEVTATKIETPVNFSNPGAPTPPVTSGIRPSVSANPISINSAGPPASSSPVVEDSVAEVPEFAGLSEVDEPDPISNRRGFFNRFLKSKPSPSIDMNTADETPPETEVGSDSTDVPEVVENIDPEISPEEETWLFDLPSSSSPPEGRNARSSASTPSENRRGGLAKFFSKSRGNRSFDVPDRPIPISVNSGGNNGNPYTDDSFRAADSSPLMDDPSQIRDMTNPNSLPTGNNFFEPAISKAVDDVSQYYIVKKDETTFQPYKYGSSMVDYENTYKLFAGTVVRDLGLVAGKRRIQIDSGERGLVSKSAVRPLSTSESATMKAGIKDGRRWYSILDTDAEMHVAETPAVSDSEIGSPTPTQPTPPPKPKGPVKKLAVKPDNDISQYYIVEVDGATFEPFTSGTRQTDPDAAYQLFEGTVLKVLGNTGENKIVHTFTGENGLISNAVVRPLNDTEKTQMSEGISGGKAWYSILDTAGE